MSTSKGYLITVNIHLSYSLCVVCSFLPLNQNTWPFSTCRHRTRTCNCQRTKYTFINVLINLNNLVLAFWTLESIVRTQVVGLYEWPDSIGDTSSLIRCFQMVFISMLYLLRNLSVLNMCTWTFISLNNGVLYLIKIPFHKVC